MADDIRTPVSGIEEQLARWAGEEVIPRTPESGIEEQLARIAGENIEPRTPESAIEQWLELIYEQGGGGGGDEPTGTITITENGTHNVKQYASAAVAVPDPFAARLNGTLTSYSSTTATAVAAHSFDACTTLTSVFLPNVRRIYGWGFQGCTGLTEVYFEKLDGTNYSGLNQSAFNGCTNLAKASFPVFKGVIGDNAFADCSSLTDLSFDNSPSVPKLNNRNAFTGTPIADGTGTIWVPDALLDTWKAGTNWSYYASQIKPKSQRPSA